MSLRLATLFLFLLRAASAMDAEVVPIPARHDSPPEKIAADLADEIVSSDAFRSGNSGTITFPVEVSIDELQAMVNDKAPPGVEKDKTQRELSSVLKDDWVEYHVHRGEIELIPVASAEVLGFSVPVSGRVAAGGKFLKIIPASGAIDFDGNVVGSIRAALKEDWSPDIQVAFDADFEKAHLKLFHVVGFSVKDHLKSELQKRMPSIQKALHKELDKLALQNRMLPFWAQLHKTIRLTKNPEAWIQIRPSTMAMSPLHYDEQRRLLFNVQVDFDAVTYLGEKPPDQVPGPLPKLGQVHDAVNAFKVSTPSYISVDALAAFVTKQFFPLNFAVNPQVNVTFVKLGLATAGDKLNVSIDALASGGMFAEKTPVTLNATAVPKLDAEKRELRFDDLKYTVETENYLARSASALLQPVVLAKLQEKARFEFGALLEKSRGKVNDIMLSKKANKNVEVKVHFDKMVVANLAIQPNRLVIFSDAEGALEMKLHPK